jgi:hypothetical protein
MLVIKSPAFMSCKELGKIILVHVEVCIFAREFVARLLTAPQRFRRPVAGRVEKRNRWKPPLFTSASRASISSRSKAR